MLNVIQVIDLCTWVLCTLYHHKRKFQRTLYAVYPTTKKFTPFISFFQICYAQCWQISIVNNGKSIVNNGRPLLTTARVLNYQCWQKTCWQFCIVNTGNAIVNNGHPLLTMALLVLTKAMIQ